MSDAEIALTVAASGGAILIVILVLLLGVLRRLDRGDPSRPLALLQQQIDGLRDQVRASLEGGRQQLDSRLQETNRVVGDVRRGLGEVDRQMQGVGNTARELKGLQELLRSPKVRGGMGELLLAELLAEVLPRANFELQHEFPGGERVDAIIHLGTGTVPVDAKFPLENFRRLRGAHDEPDVELGFRRAFRADVRRHIDAISRKYVRPGEGTFDFAMMYLPAEAVYRELIEQEGSDGLDLFHYALRQNVVPVSPQSFYAYLQVIVLGLRGLSIETRSREIMERLGSLRGRIDRLTESFDVTTRHLSNAQRQLEEAGRRLARLDATVDELAGAETETETEPAGEGR